MVFVVELLVEISEFRSKCKHQELVVLFNDNDDIYYIIYVYKNRVHLHVNA